MVFQSAYVLQFPTHSTPPQHQHPDQQYDLTEDHHQMSSSNGNGSGSSSNWSPSINIKGESFDPFLIPSSPLSGTVSPDDLSPLSRSSSPCLSSSSSSISLSSISSGSSSSNSNNETAASILMGNNSSLVCPQCEKQLCDKRSLTRHLWTHSKPHFCPVNGCIKRFSTEVALKTHILRHSRSEYQSEFASQAVSLSLPNLSVQATEENSDNGLSVNATSAAVVYPYQNEKETLNSNYCNSSGNLHGILPALVWPTSTLGFSNSAPVIATPTPVTFASLVHFDSAPVSPIESEVSSAISSVDTGSLISPPEMKRISTGPTRVSSLSSNGSKRYHCALCSRDFATSSKLSRHLLTHTGERPHKCPYSHCSRSFARRDKLGEHMRTHTGEKPYSCEIDGCNLVFTFRSGLIQHTHKHHPDLKEIKQEKIRKQSKTKNHSASKAKTTKNLPEVEPFDEGQDTFNHQHHLNHPQLTPMQFSFPHSPQHSPQHSHAYSSLPQIPALSLYAYAASTSTATATAIDHSAASSSSSSLFVDHDHPVDEFLDPLLNDSTRTEEMNPFRFAMDEEELRAPSNDLSLDICLNIQSTA